jgi:hypothetical protein
MSRRDNTGESLRLEETAMKEIWARDSMWVRAAVSLNQRVIRTSYLKSAIYFVLAIAAFLLVYFFMMNRSVLD